MEYFSDWASKIGGNPWFLLIHVLWFTLWIVFKVESFPFGLLTMMVSLESIILSSLILSASDRESERDRELVRRDLRLSSDTFKLLSHMHGDITDMRNQLLEEEEEI